MDIKVLPAQPADWLIIQKLNNEVFLADAPHDPDLDVTYPFSPAGIKYYQHLASGKLGCCLIAYAGNEPVGYVALAPKNFSYRKSRYVEIDNIGVTPVYRSRGIGRQLMEASIAWAKTHGATRLFVSAYWQNTAAINFYKRSGFTEIGLELEKVIT